MSLHPFSLIGALVRAPIYHCNVCRHQYRDWRSARPDTGASPDSEEHSEEPDGPSSPASKDAAARARANDWTQMSDDGPRGPIESDPPDDQTSGTSTGDSSIALA